MKQLCARRAEAGDRHLHGADVETRIMIVGVKHAGAEALNALEPLLIQPRLLGDLKERKPGVFYRKSRAYLHFHEDPAGLFADVRLADSFERFEVTSPEQQEALLQRLSSER
jgi:hypothetical protein